MLKRFKNLQNGPDPQKIMAGLQRIGSQRDYGQIFHDICQKNGVTSRLTLLQEIAQQLNAAIESQNSLKIKHLIIRQKQLFKKPVWLLKNKMPLNSQVAQQCLLTMNKLISIKQSLNE